MALLPVGGSTAFLNLLCKLCGDALNFTDSVLYHILSAFSSRDAKKRAAVRKMARIWGGMGGFFQRVRRGELHFARDCGILSMIAEFSMR